MRLTDSGDFVALIEMLAIQASVSRFTNLGYILNSTDVAAQPSKGPKEPWISVLHGSFCNRTVAQAEACGSQAVATGARLKTGQFELQITQVRCPQGNAGFGNMKDLNRFRRPGVSYLRTRVLRLLRACFASAWAHVRQPVPGGRGLTLASRFGLRAVPALG